MTIDIYDICEISERGTPIGSNELKRLLSLLPPPWHDHHNGHVSYHEATEQSKDSLLLYSNVT